VLSRSKALMMNYSRRKMVITRNSGTNRRRLRRECRMKLRKSRLTLQLRLKV